MELDYLMAGHLKIYHKILPVFFIPICIAIVVWYGWIGYSTLTERQGLNGDWYYYYQLTRQQYYIYNFTVALIAFLLIILQLTYLTRAKARSLSLTLWVIILFIALVIGTEMYLETRRIYKG